MSSFKKEDFAIGSRWLTAPAGSVVEVVEIVDVITDFSFGSKSTGIIAAELISGNHFRYWTDEFVKKLLTDEEVGFYLLKSYNCRRPVVGDIIVGTVIVKLEDKCPDPEKD